MTRVGNEIAFGLENVGTRPERIWPRVENALAAVGCAGSVSDRPRSSPAASCSVCASRPRWHSNRACCSSTSRRPSWIRLERSSSSLPSGRHAAPSCSPSSGSGARSRSPTESCTSRRGEYCSTRQPATRRRGWRDTGPATGWRRRSRSRCRRQALGASPCGFGGPSSRTAAARGCWTACPCRCGAARSWRSPEPTDPARRLWPRSPPACSCLPPEPSSARGERRTSRRIRAGISFARPCSTRSRSASAGTAPGRQRRSRHFGLGFAAERHPRDLSSGERERLGLAAVSVSAPDLLVLDEPTRGVDPDRKAQLGEWLLAQAAAGRGILVATHDRSLPAHRRVTIDEAREVPVAGIVDVPVRTHGRRGGAVGGARPVARRAGHAARRDRTRCGRLRMARGGRRHRARSHARRCPRWHCSSRAGVVHADPGRSACHRHRRRGGSRAGPAPWVRRRRARSDRVEHVPRARASYAVADAGVGWMRRRRRPGPAAARAAIAVRGLLRCARPRIRHRDGSLALVRLLSAHVDRARRQCSEPGSPSTSRMRPAT